MVISPIRIARDYRRALRKIEILMMAKRGTPEGDRLDILVTLVEAWEAKHYPLDLPDAVSAIRYHMEQKGLTLRDLIPFVGRRKRVYEVLNGKRPPTLKMVWRLHTGLGIPAESLIKQSRIERPDREGTRKRRDFQIRHISFEFDPAQPASHSPSRR